MGKRDYLLLFRIQNTKVIYMLIHFSHFRYYYSTFVLNISFNFRLFFNIINQKSLILVFKELDYFINIFHLMNLYNVNMY